MLWENIVAQVGSHQRVFSYNHPAHKSYVEEDARSWERNHRERSIVDGTLTIELFEENRMPPPRGGHERIWTITDAVAYRDGNIIAEYHRDEDTNRWSSTFPMLYGDNVIEIMRAL